MGLQDLRLMPQQVLGSVLFEDLSVFPDPFSLPRGVALDVTTGSQGGRVWECPGPDPFLTLTG